MDNSHTGESSSFENSELFRQMTSRDAAVEAYKRAGSMFTATDFIEHAVFVSPRLLPMDPALRGVFFSTLAEQMRFDAERRAVDDDPLNPAGAAENSGVGDVEQLRAVSAACSTIARIYNLCGTLPIHTSHDAVAHIQTMPLADARRYIEGMRSMLELARTIEGYNWLEILGLIDQRHYHEPALRWSEGEVGDWGVLEERASEAIRQELSELVFGTKAPGTAQQFARSSTSHARSNPLLIDLGSDPRFDRLRAFLLSLPQSSDGRLRWPIAHGSRKELAWLIERLYGDQQPALFPDASRWQRMVSMFIGEDGREINTETMIRQAERLRNGSDAIKPPRVERWLDGSVG